MEKILFISQKCQMILIYSMSFSFFVVEIFTPMSSWFYLLKGMFNQEYPILYHLEFHIILLYSSETTSLYKYNCIKFAYDVSFSNSTCEILLNMLLEVQDKLIFIFSFLLLLVTVSG